MAAVGGVTTQTQTYPGYLPSGVPDAPPSATGGRPPSAPKPAASSGSTVAGPTPQDAERAHLVDEVKGREQALGAALAQCQTDEQALAAAQKQESEERSKAASLGAAANSATLAAEQAKAEYDTALGSSKAADQAVDAAQTELKDAQTGFDAARTAASLAQAGLDASQTALDAARAEVNAAKSALAAARWFLKPVRLAQLLAKEVALNGAQAALADAKLTLNNAEAGVDAAQARLSAAQTGLAGAQAAAIPLERATQDALTKLQAAEQAATTARTAFDAQTPVLQLATATAQAAAATLAVRWGEMAEAALAQASALRALAAASPPDLAKESIKRAGQLEQGAVALAQARVNHERATAAPLEAAADAAELVAGQAKAEYDAALKLDPASLAVEGLRGFVANMQEQVDYLRSRAALQPGQAQAQALARAERRLSHAQAQLARAQAVPLRPATQLAQTKWETTTSEATAARAAFQAQAALLQQANGALLVAETALAAGQAQWVNAQRAEAGALRAQAAVTQSEAAKAGLIQQAEQLELSATQYTEQIAAGRTVQEAVQALSEAQVQIAVLEQTLAAAQTLLDEARANATKLDTAAIVAEGKAAGFKADLEALDKPNSDAQAEVKTRAGELAKETALVLLPALAEMARLKADQPPLTITETYEGYIDTNDAYGSQESGGAIYGTFTREVSNPDLAYWWGQLSAAQQRLDAAQNSPSLLAARQRLTDAQDRAAPLAKAAQEARAKWQTAASDASAARAESDAHAPVLQHALDARQAASEALEAGQGRLVDAANVQAGALRALAAKTPDTVVAEALNKQADQLEQWAADYTRFAADVHVTTADTQNQLAKLAPLQAEALAQQQLALSLEAKYVAASEAYSAASTELQSGSEDFRVKTEAASTASTAADTAYNGMVTAEARLALPLVLLMMRRQEAIRYQNRSQREVELEEAADRAVHMYKTEGLVDDGNGGWESARRSKSAPPEPYVAPKIWDWAEVEKLAKEDPAAVLALWEGWLEKQDSALKLVRADDLAQFKEGDNSVIERLADGGVGGRRFRQSIGLGSSLDLGEVAQLRAEYKAARQLSLDTAKAATQAGEAAKRAGEQQIAALNRIEPLRLLRDAALSQLQQATKSASVAAQAAAAQAKVVSGAQQAEQTARQHMAAGQRAVFVGAQVGADQLRVQATAAKDPGVAQLLREQANRLDQWAGDVARLAADAGAGAERSGQQADGAAASAAAWDSFALGMQGWAAGVSELGKVVPPEATAAGGVDGVASDPVEQFTYQTDKEAAGFKALRDSTTSNLEWVNGRIDWSSQVVLEHGRRDEYVQELHEARVAYDKAREKARKNQWKQIVVVVAAVAISVWTAGAASAYMATAMQGTALAAGTACTAAGSMAWAGTAIAAGVGAAAGSVASQAVYRAAGMQSGFSGKDMLTAALTAGVGSGISTALDVSSTFGGNAVGRFMNQSDPWSQASKGLVSNVLSQSVMSVLGVQDFDWRNAAAAGLSAGVKGGLAPTFGGDIAGSTALNVVGSFVSQKVQLRDVDLVNAVADGYGNALGSDLVKPVVERIKDDTWPDELTPPSLDAEAAETPATKDYLFGDPSSDADAEAVDSDAQFNRDMQPLRNTLSDPFSDMTPDFSIDPSEDVGAGYVAKAGDSVSRIAELHGITPEQFAFANGLDPANLGLIQRGKEYWIPGAAQTDRPEYNAAASDDYRAPLQQADADYRASLEPKSTAKPRLMMALGNEEHLDNPAELKPGLAEAAQRVLLGLASEADRKLLGIDRISLAGFSAEAEPLARWSSPPAEMSRRDPSFTEKLADTGRAAFDVASERLTSAYDAARDAVVENLRMSPEARLGLALGELAEAGQYIFSGPEEKFDALLDGTKAVATSAKAFAASVLTRFAAADEIEPFDYQAAQALRIDGGVDAAAVVAAVVGTAWTTGRTAQALPSLLARRESPFSYEIPNTKDASAAPRTATVYPPGTASPDVLEEVAGRVIEQNLPVYRGTSPEQLGDKMNKGYIVVVKDTPTDKPGVAVVYPNYQGPDGRAGLPEDTAYLGQVVAGSAKGSGSDATVAAYALAHNLGAPKMVWENTGGSARFLYSKDMEKSAQPHLDFYRAREDDGFSPPLSFQPEMTGVKVRYNAPEKLADYPGEKPPAVNDALEAKDPLRALGELPAVELQKMITTDLKNGLKSPGYQDLWELKLNPEKTNWLGTAVSSINERLNPFQKAPEARTELPVKVESWYDAKARAYVSPVLNAIDTTVYGGKILAVGGAGVALATGGVEVERNNDASIALFNAAPGSESITLRVPDSGFSASLWFTGPNARGPYFWPGSEDPTMPTASVGKLPLSPTGSNAFMFTDSTRANLGEVGAGVQWAGNNEVALRDWAVARVGNLALNARASVSLTAQPSDVLGASVITSATPIYVGMYQGAFAGPAGIMLRETEFNPTSLFNLPLPGVGDSDYSFGGNTARSSMWSLTVNPVHGKPEPTSVNATRITTDDIFGTAYGAVKTVGNSLEEFVSLAGDTITQLGDVATLASYHSTDFVQQAIGRNVARLDGLYDLLAHPVNAAVGFYDRQAASWDRAEVLAGAGFTWDAAVLRGEVGGSYGLLGTAAVGGGAAAFSFARNLGLGSRGDGGGGPGPSSPGAPLGGLTDGEIYALIEKSR